jgi:syndetin
MGFSEFFIQNVAIVPSTYASMNKAAADKDSADDEVDKETESEILEATEAIYFAEHCDTEVYELQKLTGDEFQLEEIAQNMSILKQQQKVISKKVLNLILDQRAACNDEFVHIGATEKLLQESVWVCQQARSCLSLAKNQLTTTSLEILATYRKREILLELLQVLKTLKKIKSTDQKLQTLLKEENYSGAIDLLCVCKALCEQNRQFACIESLSAKLQDTFLLTEVQLEQALNETTQNFQVQRYVQIVQAYKLLDKTLIAMDTLHMQFISTVHSNAFGVLKATIDQTADGNANKDQQQKFLYEQLCGLVPVDRYIPCLIALCKSFWRVLVSYYQVTLWHQNYKLYGKPAAAPEDGIAHDDFICEKLKNGQNRLWNDMQAKVVQYLGSGRLHQLKFENFIQVLAIVQRLKKVGAEFCESGSEKLMQMMRGQSAEFFKRYHSTCLDEISLFLDHEIWVQVTAFTDVLQLQEFRNVKRALRRHRSGMAVGSPAKISATIIPASSSAPANLGGRKYPTYDNDSSAHSQDAESSIYGSCGYFLRFNEKSSPFDGGFDETMLEEDILAGIADESCYYSDESEEITPPPEDSSATKAPDDAAIPSVIINNSSLTVLRCLGRYLQMCRLLHSIAPEIVVSMTELIDFYVYAVHDLFAKDLPVASDNLYTPRLARNLQRIAETVLPKIKKTSPKHAPAPHTGGRMQQPIPDLQDPETLFGLTKRINAVESCQSLLSQFDQLFAYLKYLLSDQQAAEGGGNNNDEAGGYDDFLENYAIECNQYVQDLRKPVYMCTTARVIDISAVLTAMAKTKFDVNNVPVGQSPYIDMIHRVSSEY